MQISQLLALSVCISGAVTAAVAQPGARASRASFTTFDAQGAGTGSHQGTFPVSMSSTGSITGYYLDANDNYHGFLRAGDGTITTFDVPRAGVGARVGAMPASINRAGSITGSYNDVSGATRGFIRTPDGTFNTFAALKGTGPSTLPSINAAGVVAGSELDGTSSGFVRAADDSITTFSVPNAVTQAWFVNSAGSVAGTFEPIFQGGASGVFLRSSGGTVTTFNVPGATFAAINDLGAVMGTYITDQTAYGFLLATDGTVTPFDVSGAGQSGTVALAINRNGSITGYYGDIGNAYHGFLRSPSGAIVTFDAPVLIALMAHLLRASTRQVLSRDTTTTRTWQVTASCAFLKCYLSTTADSQAAAAQ